MPTRDRREKDKLREQAKLVEEQLWERAVAEIPAHIQTRLGSQSLLSNKLYTDAPHLNRIGVLFDDHTGQPFKQELPPEQGANVETREKREDTARDLRERHRAIWGKRGYAKQIAHAEGLSVRRVQRMIKDYP